MPASLMVAGAAYCTIAVAASRLSHAPLVARRLLRVYIAYGLVAFIARGAYLAVTEPRPQFNDPSAIAGLYRYGYDDGLTRIIWFQTLSLGVVALAVGLVSRLFRTLAARDTIGHIKVRTSLAVGLIATYLAGWILRLWGLGLGSLDYGDAASQARPLAKFASLALLVPVFLLISTNWRRPSLERGLLALIIPCEIGWALLANTKTPAVALAIAAYIGSPTAPANFSLWSAVNRRRGYIALGVGAVVVFSVVNGAREPRFATTPRASAMVSTASELLRSPSSFAVDTASRVFVRFDGLDASSVALLGPPKQYMDVWEAGTLSLEFLAPSALTGTSKETPGTLWAVRMTGAKNGVSLAEGIAAEGFAIGGVAYLVAWAALLGGTMAVAALGIAASRPLTLARFVSVSFVTSAALYERGLLGLIEHAVNSSQVGLIAWLILSSIATLLTRSSHGNSSKRPRSNYSRGVA